MTGPTLRHWLTGLVFAVLAHVALAALLMGLMREQPREAASGDPAGLEVALFPGFREAIQVIAPAGPPAPGPETVPAPPAPVLPTDVPPEEAPALPIETVAALEPQAALQPVTSETSPPTATPVETVTALEPVPAVQPIAPEPAPPSSPAAPVEAVTAAEPERAVQPVAPTSSAAAAPALEPLPPEPVESAPLASIEEATTVGDVPGTVASAVPADPVPVAATPVSEPESAATGPPPGADPETIPSVDAVPLGPETVTGAREVALPTGTAAQAAPDRDEDAATEQPAPQPTTRTREIAGAEEGYFATLRDWLDRHKDYPRIAQRRGEEGTVWLAFTLNRHGMVLNHAIVRSSGHTILDNTVEHLIRRAQPLPAIPPELETDLLRLRIPIEFRLER